MRVAVGGPIMLCLKVRTIQQYMNCMNCNKLSFSSILYLFATSHGE